MLNRASMVFLIIIAATLSVAFIVLAVVGNDNPKSPTEASPPPPVSVEKEPAIPESKPATLPSRMVLNVPFFSQAPFGIWDELHGEACEEASFLMVRLYDTKQTPTLEEFDQLIINFVHWQTSRGFKVDLTVAQLSEAAKQYYGFTGARLIADPTVEQIKQEIVAGRPVIVPAAGRMLPNPNFTPPGPLYHMLVIKGYDQDGFITNDPGTRRGEGFHYQYLDLYEAIHDWNSADITLGAKTVLVYDR